MRFVRFSCFCCNTDMFSQSTYFSFHYRKELAGNFHMTPYSKILGMWLHQMTLWKFVTHEWFWNAYWQNFNGVWLAWPDPLKSLKLLTLNNVSSDIEVITKLCGASSKYLKLIQIFTLQRSQKFKFSKYCSFWTGEPIFIILVWYWYWSYFARKVYIRNISRFLKNLRRSVTICHFSGQVENE